VDVSRRIVVDKGGDISRINSKSTDLFAVTTIKRR
jgi:hypothetical protein